MSQFIAIIISFLSIPILNGLRIPLSYTLLITAGILGITSGIGYRAILESILMVFIGSSSQSTLLTILMVSTLGGLMKHYKILDKIVEIIILIIPNKKYILIIIPAIIGILVMPGGALLSAPFINNIGCELNIPPSRRAAINLVFRHISLFLLPYSTSLLIIVASLPNINISRIILMNLFFVIPITYLGYKLYLSDIKSEGVTQSVDFSKNLFKLLLLLSPIYLCVIIHIFTGLPLYLTLISSIIIVYFLGDKKEFIKSMFKSINYKSILTVVDILIIKEVILNMNSLIALFNNLIYLTDDVAFIMLIFLISSMFFGFITGNQSASLVIILPIISQLKITDNILYNYIYLISVSAFLGYFFSPIHLCQAFTVQVMNVTTLQLYKEYKLYFPISILILLISFLILNFLFQ